MHNSLSAFAYRVKIVQYILHPSRTAKKILCFYTWQVPSPHNGRLLRCRRQQTERTISCGSANALTYLVLSASGLSMRTTGQLKKDSPKASHYLSYLKSK